MKIRDCLRAASEAFNVPVPDLIRPCRVETVAFARQAAMLLARWEGYSAERIGRAMGGRDKTTIYHGERAATKRADADEEYGDMLQAAHDALTGLRDGVGTGR